MIYIYILFVIFTKAPVVLWAWRAGQAPAAAAAAAVAAVAEPLGIRTVEGDWFGELGI